NRAVVLDGEPGIGKSRLCYELLTTADSSCRVLEVSASAYGRPALEVLGALVFAELDIARDAPLEVVRAALDARIDQTPELAGFCCALATALGLPDEDRDWAALDPAARRQQSFEAVRVLLRVIAAAHPLVLLIEDLHWLDEGSIAFLSTLID